MRHEPERGRRTAKPRWPGGANRKESSMKCKHGIHYHDGGCPYGCADEYLARLTAPQGSFPASGSEDAKRPEDQSPDKNPTSASPFGGQGTGELERVLENARRSAAQFDADLIAGMERGMSDRNLGKLEGAACALRAMLAFAAALRSEPRPQSEHRVDEPCARCDGEGWAAGDGGWRGECPDCHGTGNRSERSGPPNARGVGPEGDKIDQKNPKA